MRAEQIEPTSEAFAWVLQGERGEAEKKAAAVLGLDPRRVAVLSVKLWGHSLTTEREVRFKTQEPGTSGARSLRTLRGHITRGLITELRAAAGGAKE